MKLQGIYDRIANGSITRDGNRRQPTIITSTMIDHSINITRNMNKIRNSTIIRIELQGIYDRIANGSITRDGNRRQPTIITSTMIDHSINITRNMNKIRSPTPSSIKLKTIYNRSSDTPSSIDGNRHQPTIITRTLIGYSINITRNMNKFRNPTLSSIKLKCVYDIRIYLSRCRVVPVVSCGVCGASRSRTDTGFDCDVIIWVGSTIYVKVVFVGVVGVELHPTVFPVFIN